MIAMLVPIFTSARNRIDYLSAFRVSGAIGENQAKTLTEIGVEDNKTLKTLIKRKEVLQIDNRYYINIS